MSAAARELLQLKEQREHIRYLLTRHRLAPEYRLKFEFHLARIEKLIFASQKMDLSNSFDPRSSSH